MQTIQRELLKAKLAYDSGQNPFGDIIAITECCLKKLKTSAKKRKQGILNGKEYWVFHSKNNISRPYIPNVFIDSPSLFGQAWKDLVNNLDGKKHCIKLTSSIVTKVIYSAITSFCACYDLWKPSSRKTPGTYYEILVGSILGELLPSFQRTKHITIPDSSEAVSTDIVFIKEGEDRGLVFPVKITTRERIVQPFAHQRILDSVFGQNTYRSILLCVSELQRDEHDNVKEICVPGTIRLFQKHLANLTGIYYLDPPGRYLQKDLTDVVRVANIGELLTNDLAGLIH